MHTRTVTTVDGNGHTHVRTETYWSWDTVGRDAAKSADASFMGTDLPVTVSNYSYHSIYQVSSKDRIVFRTIPLTQYGLIHPTDIAASEIPLRSITMEQYESTLYSSSRYWVLWIVLSLVIGGATLFIYISDWDWLNK